MAGAGYNSDEEVYAAARAVDGADQYDSDDNPMGPGVIDKKKIEPLPALDHAAIEYDEFAKDFYEEAPAIAAMTPAEVRAVPDWCHLWATCSPLAYSRLSHCLSVPASSSQGLQRLAPCHADLPTFLTRAAEVHPRWQAAVSSRCAAGRSIRLGHSQ